MGPVTNQISKFQRIADEQTKLLRQTRVELDVEKMETQALVQEKEELVKERKNLRESLDQARQKLDFVQSQIFTNKEHEENELTKYQELQQQIKDKKESEKYVSNLEEQLQTAL